VAVTKNGYALKFASPELQNNEAIVRAAVTQHRSAIQFASARLRRLIERENHCCCIVS
jgi:hypothetical protein